MDDKQKQRSLQRIVRRIVQTERLKNKYNALRNTAIQVTRSFDQEVEARKKEQEKKIADAFQKMIRWLRSLELENEKQLVREEAEARRNENKIDKVKRKIPRRIRNFPDAFKRKPLVVIKYFLYMILGRVLAIVLYISIPDAVFDISKPPEFFGKALSSMRNFFTDSLSSMRSFFTDFNPQMIFTTVKNIPADINKHIPADINKLIQKLGDFFTFYAKRTYEFIKWAIQNPQSALQDMRDYLHKANFNRLARTVVGVIFSFLLIKLVIIFLLPVFGGIALTVLGIKVSIILFVIVRMIADKIGALLSKYIFKRNISEFQLVIVKIICGYLRDKVLGKS